MHLSVVHSLEKIPAQAWNALAGEAYPFIRHEFLHALERTGCVGPGTGWLPQYLVLHNDGPLQGQLVGATPLYLKHHSYGEYVFDWAWADAYARTGQQYYPKLVVGIPFTPATGPRLLALDDEESIKKRLIEGALAQANETAASSLHWLFTTAADTRLLEMYGHMQRTGCQFHWRNPGYRDFDDFLSTFTAQKRKKVKRERRFVRDAGVTIEIIAGTSITPMHWDIFYEFYLATIQAHGAIPYLRRDFFYALGASMPQATVLVFARHGVEYVAGALNLRGRDTLYGRYWGSRQNFHSLHFETCYYAAIDYCITQGISYFEAGAQGEHKLARGFTPAQTYSAHWLRHPSFAHAVADYLTRERNGIELYIDELNEHVPFKDKLNTI